MLRLLVHRQVLEQLKKCWKVVKLNDELRGYGWFVLTRT